MKQFINIFKSPWDEDPFEKKAQKEVPDLGYLFDKGKKHFKKIVNNNGSTINGKIFVFLSIILFLLWLCTGFFAVDQSEKAVILRLGKFHRIVGPGLSYHVPEPFETMIKENFEEIRREEIGYRSSSNGSNIRNNGKSNNEATTNLVPYESFMLTGDENIFDMHFEVQWKISDIKDYIFNIVGVKKTVKSAAESAVREVIGNMPFTQAQTEGREVVAQKTKTVLQDMLDSYKSGVQIRSIQMKKMDPPAEVIDSFRDVQTAKADKERSINQADAHYNEILPKSRGEAAKIIQEAEAYKKQVTEIAKGDASRFDAVYEQYKLAKSITKKRIYLETMEFILENMDKLIVDDIKGQGVVPYLALPEMDKKKGEK